MTGHPLAGRLRHAGETVERLARGVALLQEARAGVASTRSIVQHLRDVAVLAEDRTLSAADRVTLQQQVDRALADLDETADTTSFDVRLLANGAPADGVELPSAHPFSEVGSADLGLTDLSVRTPDEAFAATHALDLAFLRVHDLASSLDTRAGQFDGALAEALSRSALAAGSAIGSAEAAREAVALARQALTTRGEQAPLTHGRLDPARVQRLLG
ncbi:MAG: hypothetical protein IT305_22900 [Chloroflexi bacterium]|nr:hypothetical protein [Chloroflexota bacterium]